MTTPALTVDVFFEVAARTLDDGGITVRVSDMHEPLTGYAVSLPGTEERIPLWRFDAEAVAQYVGDHLDDLTASDRYLGAWVDGVATVYLDVTEVIPDRATAVRLGRERHQLAIFDIDRQQDIRLT